ncbi:MAG: hypothetical protein Q9174_006347, partial [Haloplaca sp. 1 TL-2023]
MAPNVNINSRRSQRAIKKSSKAKEVESSEDMASAPTTAAKVQKPAAKKASKAKGKAKAAGPLFPNLPGADTAAPATATTTDDVEAAATSPEPAAKAKTVKKPAAKKAAASKASKAKGKTKAAAPLFPNLPGAETATATTGDDAESTKTSPEPATKATNVAVKKPDAKGKGKAAEAKKPAKRSKDQTESDSEPENNDDQPPAKKSKTTGARPAKVAAKGKGGAPATKKTAMKRKNEETDDEGTTSGDEKSASEAPPAKRVKVLAAVQKSTAKAPKAPKATKEPKAKAAPKPKPKVVINTAPQERLHVYVMGEGSSGELGLGTNKLAIDVKRPRLNPHLSADTVGVVQVACGGMHVLALTHDGKVLTWGVNDQGALGRNTDWDGGLRDVGDSDSESDSDSDSDSGLNPHESTPTAITTFPEGTVIVKLSAGDSHSLALTDDGLVYGWGTFRNNEGILGFNVDTFVQKTPVLLPGLKKIKDITSGSNHALALNDKGVVYTWGAGQQNQLGFRMMERKRYESLIPSLLRLRGKKVRYIACGADHSFAIDGKEQVWAWGANSFGGTGIYEGAGEDNAVIISPTVVKNLKIQDDTITTIAGGTHHSLASTANGQCLVWGRFDGSQTGIDAKTIPEENMVRDARKTPRILVKPTRVPGVENCSLVAAGTDHSMAITRDGKGFSWGFSANYQTGQGTDDD